MIAQASNVTTEQTIYACPSGKRAMVEVYVYGDDSNINLKVNESTVIEMLLSGTLSLKLILDQGDVIKLSSATNPANIFVSGMVV